MPSATCLHCYQDCRMTDGKEVYPNRADLAGKIIYVCDSCGSRVGCHPGTEAPLGQAANEATRKARMRVHAVIDPYWKRNGPYKVNRRAVYLFLQRGLSLSEAECHVGSFDVDQCAQALDLMRAVTARDLKSFEGTMGATKGSLNKGKKKKRSGKKSKHGNTMPAVITGALFCPNEAAKSEVPW